MTKSGNHYYAAPGELITCPICGKEHALTDDPLPGLLAPSQPGEPLFYNCGGNIGMAVADGRFIYNRREAQDE